MGLDKLSAIETRASLVVALAEETVTDIACGKRHTLFLAASGAVYACGANSYGQCGTGRTSERVIVPTRINELDAMCKAVSCGIDYSMILASDGRLFACGYPANGRLGLGTDGSYNASASSIKMVYESNPVPKQLPGLWRAVSAGNSHCLGIDINGKAHSWGDGTYGRLGSGAHSNKDQHSPFPLSDANTGRYKEEVAAVYAGRTFSLMCLAGPGMTFAWGRMRQNSPVKPAPEYEDGFNGGGKISSVGFTNDGLVFVAGSDACCVGSGLYRQLAVAPGKGSAPKPSYCGYLADVSVKQVACGLETTLFLVQRKGEGVSAAGLATLSQRGEADLDTLDAVLAGTAPAPDGEAACKHRQETAAETSAKRTRMVEKGCAMCARTDMTLKVCPCKSVAYCSIECQKKHYKSGHKPEHKRLMCIIKGTAAK